MAAGKPVIINHGGWIAQLIQKENIGLVLNRDISESCQNLISFFTDQKRLYLASKNSKELGLTRYNKDFLINKLENNLKLYNI